MTKTITHTMTRTWQESRRLLEITEPLTGWSEGTVTYVVIETTNGCIYVLTITKTSEADAGEVINAETFYLDSAAIAHVLKLTQTDEVNSEIGAELTYHVKGTR
jgi:hypothetical protein